MTAEEKVVFETFKVRFRDFVNKYDSLVNEYEAFKKQSRLEIGEKNKEIFALSSRIAELEKKCEDLHVARSLAGIGEDPVVAKKRLTDIVREIDKCIALLNE